MSNTGSFISPPPRIRLWLRPLIWVADKIAGKSLLMPRLLAWSPKLALTSGFVEASAVKPEGKLTARLLKLLRLQVSLEASCAFCFDMNAAAFQHVGISHAEIEALQKKIHPKKIATLSAAERLALEFARQVTATPIAVQGKTATALRRHFSEREYLLIAATCAQVNYWARLAQALGVPPEGYSAVCKLIPERG